MTNIERTKEFIKEIVQIELFEEEIFLNIKKIYEDKYSIIIVNYNTDDIKIIQRDVEINFFVLFKKILEGNWFKDSNSSVENYILNNSMFIRFSHIKKMVEKRRRDKIRKIGYKYII